MKKKFDFLCQDIKIFVLMKAFFAVLTTSIIILSGCSSSSAEFSTIERDFISPPESVQTSIYWYWINDNISKEAVVKDLQSMKKVGINRAFIGNIGLSQQEYPYGNVKLFTDEWWEIMHTALKTATELGIEIGIFNCPGWSQSGGPWIKPEQAMRYLASSEIKVKGPKKFEQKLAQPTTDFQDVKVVAWPVDQQYQNNLFNASNARIYFSDNKMKSSKGNAKYTLLDNDSHIGLTLTGASPARSLVIYPAGNIYADAELQAKEGNEFRTIKKFNINRTNPALNVGFEPYAPIVVTFPETKSSEYRIVFNHIRKDSGIADMVLTSTPMVERYAEKSLAKMFQTPLPYWHDYLWDAQSEIKDASALVPPQQVKDLTKYMAADGTLTWDVPEGEWIIMRTGMAPTGVTNAPASPEGVGLEVDKMSKKHVADHFDAFLGKILERVPAEDRKTWKVVVEDSYETGGQNFTDEFLSEFQQRYGYDPVPFLPVFKGHTIGSPDLSDRFLWDLRRLVADKVSYDYVGGLREISNKHGLTTWLENYGHWGFPGEFLQYGGQSDEIGGEFWSEGNLGDIENRAASSCAHIYGKTKVSAESFTCGGNAYSRYPAVMKRRGDWSFTEGINNTLLHVYIQQAYEDRYPGVDAWFGNEFNRKNIWYNHLDLFIQYLKRCNYMLQQGLNVADVAYFIGEDAPKMTGVRDPEIPKGYSFDYINAEVIVRDLSVKDGKLVLPHGTSYRVLVLPKLETMRPEVLQKIEQLITEGAVVLGPPPSRSPSMQGYPEADKQVQSLAGKMWGDLSAKQRSYGKGMILNDMPMEEVFSLLNVVPDCRFADNDPVLYNHRTLSGGGDIYFLSNQSEKPITINAQFRVKGMQPELWDAISGSIRPLPAFEQSGESTIVPIQLESLESAFIVFRKKGKPSAEEIEKNYPKPELVVDINKPWEVQFESDAVKRGPSEPVTFVKLQDWSKHEDERIRYYSGTAVYKTTFSVEEMPKGKESYIDLGKVNVMAKVKINGKYAGGAWTAPYRINVSPYIQKGENTIEVEVVNTWVNRLLGDSKLPENERVVYSDKSPWKNDSQAQASGLTGPVQLVCF
ncbi:MAG: glycoside hydrolase family 2 [Bacteroidales bacterium]|jgi:hypothetical protein|nr:glycoside hydrolase family 2 [Bacteroidales bacterium]